MVLPLIGSVLDSCCHVLRGGSRITRQARLRQRRIPQRYLSGVGGGGEAVSHSRSVALRARI